MKVFVLGTSYSGKTPVATRIGERFAWPIISGGEWAKQAFDQPCRTMEEYIERITDFSVAWLRREHDVGLRHLSTYHDLTRSCVIEGERNPFDFVNLFHPRSDLVVSLIHRYNPLPRTLFERGVEVIWNYLEWLKANGIIAPFQHRRYEFDHFYVKKGAGGVALEELIPDIMSDVEASVRDLATP